LKKLKIYFLLLLIVGSSLASASITCELKPKYFSNGYELSNDNQTEITALSFQILVSNLDTVQRVISLSITNYSSNFGNLMPTNTVEFLRIKESKILWNTELIPTTNMNTPEKFSLSISSMSEHNMSFETADCFKQISLPPKENLILDIGNKVSPSSPVVGLALVIILILLFLYFKFRGNKN
jgi:hypothetical protein